jgi:hypothetical protein
VRLGMIASVLELAMIRKKQFEVRNNISEFLGIVKVRTV